MCTSSTCDLFYKQLHVTPSDSEKKVFCFFVDFNAAFDRVRVRKVCVISPLLFAFFKMILMSILGLGTNVG